jgi:uncharacterized protein (TIGR03067 family)
MTGLGCGTRYRTIPPGMTEGWAYLITLTTAAFAISPLGAEEFVRRWIDDTGGKSIKAKFLGYRDGLVGLETSPGKHIKVPIERLCDGDRHYVESVLRAEDVARLEGVWKAHASEAGGEPAPAELLERLGFEFKAKTVVVKGNSEGGEAMPACAYVLDVLRSPREIDIVVGPPDGLVRGIYSFNGDDLVICLRHGGSEGPRPKAFNTGVDPDLIQIRLRRADKSQP